MPCDLVRHFQVVYFQSTRRHSASIGNECHLRRWRYGLSENLVAQWQHKASTLIFLYFCFNQIQV